MIMINGNWEQVKDLSDIIRIINENIGYEFAQKVEEICTIEGKDMVQEINDLNNLVDDYGEKLDGCKDLINEIERFVHKVQKKYEMIER